MRSDEEQIRQLIATWHAATKAGDIDTVLGLMTEDVVFLVTGRQPMHKAEFEKLSRVAPGSQAPNIRSTSEVQEVQVSGDLTFVWTNLTVAVTPPGSHGTYGTSGPYPVGVSPCSRQVVACARCQSSCSRSASTLVMPNHSAKGTGLRPSAYVERWAS